MFAFGISRVVQIALLALGMVAAGCQWNVGTVDVRLVYSPTEMLNPLSESAGVARVRVRVEGENIRPRETEFAVGARAGTLADLPAGERVRVLVEGVDSIGLTISRGASTWFETKSGTNRIYLFIGRREMFSDPPNFPVGDSHWQGVYNSGFSQASGRVFHETVGLPDESLLVLGGSPGPFGADYLARLDAAEVLATAERFDPTAGAFWVGNLPMPAGRAHAAATGFPGVDALIVFGGDPVGAEAQTFDWVDLAFAASSASTQVPRSRQAWCSLSGAQAGLMVAGGIGETGELLSSIELLDPQSRSFSQLNPELSSARSGATAVAYEGGVLVIGGWEAFPPWPADQAPVRQASSRVDRFRFVNGSWQAEHLTDLLEARAEHTAVLVEVMKRDGDGSIVMEAGQPVLIEAVFVCGGLKDAISALGSCELIDPDEGTVQTDEQLYSLQGDRWRHTATVLDDGRVLVAGGFQGGGSAPGAYNSAVILDPDREKPVQRLPPMAAHRGGHTATRMANGMILIAGGMSNSQDMAETDYEIFVP